MSILPSESTQYDTGATTTTTLTSYDDQNYTEKVTIAVGEANATTTFTQSDGMGRVTSVTKNYGGATPATDSTFYSSTGLVWRTYDALQRETQTDYDAAGRAVRVWLPRSDTIPAETAPVAVDRTNGITDYVTGSPTTTTTYDACGNVLSTSDARFKLTSYTYDARNRKQTEAKPQVADASDSNTLKHPTTSTYYDAVGNVIKVVDPRGSKVLTFYDYAYHPIFSRTNPVTGNPSNASSPSANAAYDIVTQSSYDANGNIIAAIDGNGNITLNRYDALNRLIVTATNPSTDPNNREPVNPNIAGYNASDYQNTNLGGNLVVTNVYDDAGNLIRVTDGKGQSTDFRYDGLGRKTRTIWDPGKTLQRTEQSIYDGVLLLTKVNPDGRQINYGYDGLHRLITVTYPASGTVENPDNRKMTYDLVGNLLTVTYPKETATNQGYREVIQSFDALHRLHTEKSNGRIHTYTYDKVGNRLTTTYGGTNRYLKSTYDDQNRLSSLEEKDTEGATTSRTSSYGYDVAGNIVLKALANGARTESTYDYLGRKLKITEKQSATGSVLATFDYSLSAKAGLASGYDNVGNLLKTTESYTQTGVKGRVVTNTYDGVNRLTAESLDETGSGGSLTYTTYGYDKANNRASRTKQVNGSTTQDLVYTYGNGVTANSNQLTRYGPNVSTDTVTYTYDANGNRKTLTTNGLTDTYTYDDDNRLISLSYNTNSVLAGTYSYVYDHRTRRVRRSERGSVTVVSFSGGTSVQEWVGSTVTRQYIRGSDYGGGIGGILYSMGSASSSSIYNQYNSRGDVIGQTDASAALTWQASYEAFGKRVGEGGTVASVQRANTKDEDPWGALNEGMRYRDLETGVFLTRDPAGFVDGPNVYTYVQQNPWTKFDPNGLWSWGAFGKGLVTAAVVAAVITTGVIALPALVAIGATAIGASAITAATAAAVTSTAVTVGVTATAIAGAPHLAAEAASLTTGDDVKFSYTKGFEDNGALSDEAYSEKAGQVVGGFIGGGLGSRAGAVLDSSGRAIVARSAAKAEATLAKAEGATDGAATGMVSKKWDVITGRSEGAATNNTPRKVSEKVLDEYKALGTGRESCGEAHALTKADELGIDMKGGVSATTKVGDGGKKWSDGDPMRACLNNCKPVLENRGIYDAYSNIQK